MTPHDAFLHGARLFDQGAFFEAHEAWEERWRVETDETARRHLQGLIQIAAAFHKQVAMHDGASAARLFARGLEKLEGCAGLSAFRESVRACASTWAHGPIDPSTFPRLGAARP